MNFKNSKCIELRNFNFTTVWKFFFENLYQKWKNASCGTQFRYFQTKYVKICSIRLKILTYKSPMQSYIKN